MCNPAALIIAATAVQTIGSGVSALQAASSYRYQAKIADRNAALESEAGHEAALNGQTEAMRQYRKLAALQGQQQAAQAANGIDTGFGSALQVQQDTAMIGAEDVDSIYRQTHQAVRGYDINASNYRAEASAKRRAASGALVKGVFDMGSSILGGASQFGKLKAGG